MAVFSHLMWTVQGVVDKMLTIFRWHRKIKLNLLPCKNTLIKPKCWMATSSNWSKITDKLSHSSNSKASPSRSKNREEVPSSWLSINSISNSNSEECRIRSKIRIILTLKSKCSGRKNIKMLDKAIVKDHIDRIITIGSQVIIDSQPVAISSHLARSTILKDAVVVLSTKGQMLTKN